MTATRARQLTGLPSGTDVLAARDRAILKVCHYTGIRLGTACRLNIEDFHQDADESTLRISEKGGLHRTIGIHFAAADAVREYVEVAALTSGPLFRARRNPRSTNLGTSRISPATMYRCIGCSSTTWPSCRARRSR